MGCCIAGTAPPAVKKLPPTVTPTRTKFQEGKLVVAEIPFSEGMPLSEFRGLTGTIEGSENVDGERIYEISFNMSRQARTGLGVSVNQRKGKIIYGPDEDSEFIVMFEDTGEFSGCLKLDEITFSETNEDIRSIKLAGDYLRTAGALAASQNVHFLTVDQVIKACTVHAIPVFQRRYCWTERQCERLWQSAVTMRDAAAETNNHSIGRLMLLQREDGTRLVLDGQQRLTTLTILLSALRDRLTSLGEAKPAAQIDKLCTGRLVPTLDDRPDFERVLAEASPEGDGALLVAKRCFSALAQELDTPGCKAISLAVRQRLSALAFVLEDERGMQRVYDNLAKQVMSLEEARRMGVDLTTCHECHMEGEKQTPSTHWGPDGHRLCQACAENVGLGQCESMTPGIEMSPVDLIRNFVIEHFSPDEPTMRKIHAEYWSPLEKKTGGTAEGVEALIRAFLEQRGFSIKHRWYLYSVFMVWWKCRAAEQSTPQEHALAKLEELLKAQG